MFIYEKAIKYRQKFSGNLASGNADSQSRATFSPITLANFELRCKDFNKSVINYHACCSATLLKAESLVFHRFK